MTLDRFVLLFKKRFLYSWQVLGLLILLGAPAWPKSVDVGDDIVLNGDTYRVEKYLGKGLFGTTFKIKLKRSPFQELAMKVFSWEEAASKDRVGARHLALRGYQKVALMDPHRLILKFAPFLVKIQLDPNRLKFPSERAALLGHPNTDIVAIMPLAESDLREDMVKMDNFSQADRVRFSDNVMRDVLRQLAFFSEQGLVHVDIKPGNILRYGDGSYGVNDFDSVTEVGRFSSVKSPFYEAPERRIDNASAQTTFDIYSLGVTILQTLYLSKSDFYKNLEKWSSPAEIKKKIREIRQEIAETEPELLDRLADIENFLLASLKKNPVQRRDLFLKTKYGSLFTVPILEPETASQKVRHFLEVYVEAVGSEVRLVNKIKGTRNLVGILNNLTNLSDVFIEALRAAQMLNIPINNEREILISNLRRLPFRSDKQVDVLARYLSLSYLSKDVEVAKAIFSRFVLPANSTAFSDKWAFELVAQFPEIIKQNQAILEKKLSGELPDRELEKLVSLFKNFDSVPVSVALARARVDTKGVSNSLNLLSKQTAKAALISPISYDPPKGISELNDVVTVDAKLWQPVTRCQKFYNP